MIIIGGIGQDDYPIDAALEERLTFESDITENEVSRGSPTTDHIRAKRPVLELDGIVSDTPIGEVAKDPTRTVFAGNTSPSADAYRRFVDIHEAAAGGLIITCSFGKFEDMALASLTPVKDAKTQKAFKFTATFKQIKIIDNVRTTTRVSVPNGQGKTSLGAKQAIMNFLGKNVVWVKSIRREATTPYYIQSLAPVHKPTADKQYGTPILSTSPYDRAKTVGYPGLTSDASLLLDNYWYDHYRLSAGNQDDGGKTALYADGYVLLNDVGPKNNPGTGLSAADQASFKNQPARNRGYYHLKGGSAADSVATPGESLPTDNPFNQDAASQTIKNSKGNSLTQQPPPSSDYDQMLGNH